MGGIPPALQILGEICSNFFERTPQRKNVCRKATLRSTLLGRLNLQSKFITSRLYVLLHLHSSKFKKSFYIGYTSDLRKRFKKHNLGQSQATKPFIPYKLIFYEAFLNRIDAKNREIYLKGGYGRKTINKKLRKYLKTV